MNHVLTLRGPIPVIGYIEGDRITITRPGYLISPASKRHWAAFNKREMANYAAWAERKKAKLKERLNASQKTQRLADNKPAAKDADRQSDADLPTVRTDSH